MQSIVLHKDIHIPQKIFLITLILCFQINLHLLNAIQDAWSPELDKLRVSLEQDFRDTSVHWGQRFTLQSKLLFLFNLFYFGEPIPDYYCLITNTKKIGRVTGNRFCWFISKIGPPFSPYLSPPSTFLIKLTIKFCWRGDQEYIIGTEATALRVFSGMTCFGKSMSLVTEHWNKEVEVTIT